MRRWPQVTAWIPSAGGEAFEVVMGRIARIEPRLRTGWFALGLLSDLPRKNCRTIAEWARGDQSGWHATSAVSAAWDAEAVRDDVREYVVEHLYDEARGAAT